MRKFPVLLLLILNFVLFSMPAEECIACHGEKDLEPVTEGKKLNLFVTDETLQGSVHEGFSCTDCHGEDGFDDLPHEIEKVSCNMCHDEAYEMLSKEDVHGKAYLDGVKEAPFCADCHGSHKIFPLTEPESVMSKKNQPDNCGKCHGLAKINTRKDIVKRDLIDRYKTSVHWDAILKGDDAASCTDCHSHHSIKSSSKAYSPVSRVEVAKTCSKCHENESKAFWAGAHGSTLNYGNIDVPNCITCHGDHDMASLRDRTGEPKQWASTQVCIWCHGNERMMARYGHDTTPVESYMNDFHGLTQRGTAGASATCADCHDPHYSLPSNHPSSRMHINNIGDACGECHGTVSQKFALTFTHKKAMEYAKDNIGARIENIIRIVYLVIIWLSVLGMLAHNFVIWIKAVRDKLRKQREAKSVRRMSPFEKWSHIVLIITFFTLVITGFALKYPETQSAKLLFDLGMTEDVRAGLHRLAAVLMTVDFIIFFIYLGAKRRGRRFFVEVLPKFSDLSEFWQTIKYYIGKQEKPVKYGIFNYAEKFEFWALVWGTMIMMVTGAILWFSKTATDILPSWALGVSRVIHFYEAVLATLAIIIFHLFYVIFHPDEYPLNTSFMTGRLSEEEAKHHFTDDAIEKMGGVKKKDDE